MASKVLETYMQDGEKNDALMIIKDGIEVYGDQKADIAEFIKEKAQRKFGGKWSCFVSNSQSYANCVGYFNKMYLRVEMKNKYVFMYKSSRA